MKLMLKPLDKLYYIRSADESELDIYATALHPAYRPGLQH
jgi:hypothetical protein